eukprot:COSAG02_NODE_4361_length_5453_cov_2.128689_4_plen_204_part_00
MECTWGLGWTTVGAVPGAGGSARPGLMARRPEAAETTEVPEDMAAAGHRRRRKEANRRSCTLAISVTRCAARSVVLDAARGRAALPLSLSRFKPAEQVSDCYAGWTDEQGQPRAGFRQVRPDRGAYQCSRPPSCPAVGLTAAAVQDVHVPTDRETQRPRGFAFVTFAESRSAEEVRAYCRAQVCCGHSDECNHTHAAGDGRHE